jgi:hypothetical protein
MYAASAGCCKERRQRNIIHIFPTCYPERGGGGAMRALFLPLELNCVFVGGERQNVNLLGWENAALCSFIAVAAIF